ncbi:MAG: sugar phosphate isomerase/epimerase [Bacilli bacterium]|nr:sugar phosphate isomerase/epimerase [Bacilli bacterium]MDD4388582.1 sugar phosphate isomerase/epimerase [Bacilli bacterium]
MDHYIYLYYGFSSSIEKKIELIKKNQFKGVFLFWDDNFFSSVKKVRAAALDIETVHLPFDDCNELWLHGLKGEEYIQKAIMAIQSAATMKIPTVIFHVSSSDNPPPYNQLGIDRLAKVLKVCEQYKINIALENLRRLEYLDYIYSTFQSEYLKFCFDSGHAHAFTNNIDSFPWGKYQNKLICVHLHDNNGLYDQHLIPFTGNINWELLAKSLKEIGYSGPLTSEAVCFDCPGEKEEGFVRKIKAALEKIDRYISS